MRVLIADDCKLMREMLRAVLEEAGYEVVEAENGIQTIEAIKKNDIRLVLLDWKMPYIDGPEVCQRIMSEIQSHLVYIIIVTGNIGTENAVTALQSGASDYIVKPFHTNELLARIRVGERIINLQMQLSNLQRHAEREQNKEELKQSEFKYRTVADFTWDWEFWMSPEKQFIYVSPSCERISGYTPLEFMKDTNLFTSIVYPDDLHIIRAEIENAFSQRIQTSVDFRIFSKKRTICWVSMAYQPVIDSDNTFLGVRGSIRDITERKQTEKEMCLLQTITRLISQAEDFHTALNTVLRQVCDVTGWAYGEIWIPNASNTRLECSSSWYSTMQGTENFRKMSENITFPLGVGLPGTAWLTKKPVWIRDVTVDANFPRALIAKECGMKSGIAFPIICGNEVVAVMDFFIFQYQDEGEQFVDIISAVVTQLGMFIRQKRTEDNLKQLHLQNKHLIASVPSILISVDENNIITQWNKMAETVFGIKLDNAIGTPFQECGIQWCEKSDIDLILSCRNSAQSTRIDDVRFKNLLGKIGFLGITVTPIKEMNTLLIIGSDITQRKILEDQLIQSQKLESIGQLAAGIAHEINTPTQYVGDNTHFLQDAFREQCKLIKQYSGFLKACKSGDLTDTLIRKVEETEKEVDAEYLIDEIPKAIQQSLDGIDRVTKIVRAMKEFSHPSTEEKTPIDINKAIESTITVARNEWKYVAEVLTVFDNSLPMVPCQPDKFNQAILNIIINAAHAIGDVIGKSGNGKGIITVSTHRNGNSAEVRIQDTGTGISEEVRPKIFDPFFTTKEVGRGTGQGLAIAHDIIVKKHNGTISYETEVGRGTVFIIRIPFDSDCSGNLN